MAVLSALAVPAFLLGAALAGPPPGVPTASDAAGAPGRAALDAGPPASAAVSPAGESRARDAAAPPDAAPTTRSVDGPPAGLTVRIVGPEGPLTTDEPVRLEVRWSDGNGRYAGLSENWGDGTATSSLDPVSCAGEAGPHGDELTTAHRFPAGRFRVRLTVTTADCGGRTEERSAEVTIEVKATSGEPETEDDTATPTAPAEPETSAPAPSTGSAPATSPPGLPLPLPSVESAGTP